MLATLGPGDHAEASPGERPGQRRPLKGTSSAKGYSVFHKLHRYEVHTRETTDDHWTHAERRTG
eukprot:scaffold1063_cov60-Phaeocystis_antarctica.AAC.1